MKASKSEEVKKILTKIINNEKNNAVLFSSSSNPQVKERLIRSQERKDFASAVLKALQGDTVDLKLYL